MKKIIWAMDYLGMTPALLKNLTNTLKVFSYSDTVAIQPVSVVSESPTLGKLPGYFTDQVYENLRATCAESGLENLLEPKLIFCREPSQRKSVEKLVQFAKKGKYDAIFVASYSRRGLSRWLLGSFAESLIMQSSVPVVVVNPRQIPPQQIKHLLYPMGASAKAKPLFRQVVGLAKELGARVTILAQVEFPLQPMAQYQDFVDPQGTVSMERFVKKEKSRITAEAKSLQQIAKAARVKVDLEIGTTINPVSEIILKVAKNKKADLIAMGNESGPIGSVLLGSISRDVVRRAEVPVWIVHRNVGKKK